MLNPKATMVGKKYQRCFSFQYIVQTETCSDRITALKPECLGRGQTSWVEAWSNFKSLLDESCHGSNIWSWRFAGLSISQSSSGTNRINCGLSKIVELHSLLGKGLSCSKTGLKFVIFYHQQSSINKTPLNFFCTFYQWFCNFLIWATCYM